MADLGTALVTLSGPDRPGVTTQLFAALGAAVPADVLDVEQVVIRGQLVLGVLLGPVSGADDLLAVRRAAHEVADRVGMSVTVAAGAEEADPRRVGRVHVTVLGRPLRPGVVAALAGRIADLGANIDRIQRLSRYPVTSIEFEVSGADPEDLRSALAAEAATQAVDVAVEPSGLYRRAKRLVVMDVDSTLIQGEVIEMLAARAGCLEQVAAVTEAAMRGELDFAASLRARVALLRGVPESALDDVRREVLLSPGARTLVRTLKRLGYEVAVVSGGFTQVIEHLVRELGIDHSAANTLEVVDGVLTGGLVGAIVDRRGKANALERFAAAAGVPLSQTVAIGDGANDLDMLARSGMGIAFNAKPVVRDAADASVTVPYLDAVLYLLGISREEVEEADAAEGTPTPAPPLD
ncbi:MAG TPA: phosphoserine phosphatase SerB [Actinomycetes bacterium]|nr:phosphoserine phosphatase SerB [Actinomycetes bacterium]